MKTKLSILNYMMREMNDGHAESTAQIAGAAELPRETTRACLKGLEELGVVVQGSIVESDNDEGKVLGRGWWLSDAFRLQDSKVYTRLMNALNEEIRIKGVDLEALGIRTELQSEGGSSL